RSRDRNCSARDWKIASPFAGGCSVSSSSFIPKESASPPRTEGSCCKSLQETRRAKTPRDDLCFANQFLDERTARDSSFPRRSGAGVAYFFHCLACYCYPRGTLRLQKPAKIFRARPTRYGRSL